MEAQAQDLHYEVVVTWRGRVETRHRYAFLPAVLGPWVVEYRRFVRERAPSGAQISVVVWRHDHAIGAPCGPGCRITRWILLGPTERIHYISDLDAAQPAIGDEAA